MDIVIYEEDHLTLALLNEWLSQAGYRVRVGRLHGVQPDPSAHLVIASVYMPKRAGAHWLRDIQAVHPDTPVIAVSGQFRAGLCSAGSAAQDLGVRQVIAKPLNRANLLGAVRAIIGPTA